MNITTFNGKFYKECFCHTIESKNPSDLFPFYKDKNGRLDFYKRFVYEKPKPQQLFILSNEIYYNGSVTFDIVSEQICIEGNGHSSASNKLLYASTVELKSNKIFFARIPKYFIDEYVNKQGAIFKVYLEVIKDEESFKLKTDESGEIIILTSLKEEEKSLEVPVTSYKDNFVIHNCGKFGDEEKILSRSEAALLYIELHKFLFTDVIAKEKLEPTKKEDIIEDLQLLIKNNEDDFDRGKGKYILEDFIKKLK